MESKMPVAVGASISGDDRAASAVAGGTEGHRLEGEAQR